MHRLVALCVMCASTATVSAETYWVPPAGSNPDDCDATFAIIDRWTGVEPVLPVARKTTPNNFPHGDLRCRHASL